MRLIKRKRERPEIFIQQIPFFWNSSWTQLLMCLSFCVQRQTTKANVQIYAAIKKKKKKSAKNAQITEMFSKPLVVRQQHCLFIHLFCFCCWWCFFFFILRQIKTFFGVRLSEIESIERAICQWIQTKLWLLNICQQILSIYWIKNDNWICSSVDSAEYLNIQRYIGQHYWPWVSILFLTFNTIGRNFVKFCFANGKEQNSQGWIKDKYRNQR